jgi:hypothetical protein
LVFSLDFVLGSYFPSLKRFHIPLNMRKSAALVFLLLLLTSPYCLLSSGAEGGATGQSSQSTGSMFLINLVVDEMSEQTEDSGGVIRVNANFDEQNKNADGSPLADYQPDHMQGHRISPDDPNLKHGSFSVDTSGKGRWRLIFPEKIRVWREEEGEGHIEMISSRFSEEVETPLSRRLRNQGKSDYKRRQNHG